MRTRAESEMAKRQILRQSLYYFVRQTFRTVRPGETLIAGEYLEALCFQLQRLSETDGARAVINMPPRSLKSIAASVSLCAWHLGHNPSQHILVVCYNNDLCKELGRLFRIVIESPWYQDVFPKMRVLKGVKTDTEIITTKMGSRRGISVSGTVTGMGADLIIIDDITKASDVASETERERRKVFYDQSLYTRLNNKKDGKIICISQRLHEEDICGYLLSKGGDGEL